MIGHQYSICSTNRVLRGAFPGNCALCGRRIYYVPRAALNRVLVCGHCMLEELEKAGSVAHTVRDGKVVETYKDYEVERMVKEIHRMMKREGLVE
jgi:hypothetical protein